MYSDVNDSLNTSGQGLNSYNLLHNTNSQKESSKDYLKDTTHSTGEFKSKILESLSPIEHYFEGRVIKGAKLMYRAS